MHILSEQIFYQILYYKEHLLKHTLQPCKKIQPDDFWGPSQVEKKCNTALIKNYGTRCKYQLNRQDL